VLGKRSRHLHADEAGTEKRKKVDNINQSAPPTPPHRVNLDDCLYCSPKCLLGVAGHDGPPDPDCRNYAKHARQTLQLTTAQLRQNLRAQLLDKSSRHTRGLSLLSLSTGSGYTQLAKLRLASSGTYSSARHFKPLNYGKCVEGLGFMIASAICKAGVSPRV
jgi:hypothetical protein